MEVFGRSLDYEFMFDFFFLKRTLNANYCGSVPQVQLRDGQLYRVWFDPIPEGLTTMSDVSEFGRCPAV